MGAGAEILEQLAELRREVQRLTGLVETLVTGSSPAVDPRTAGARQIISREAAQRRRRAEREAWVERYTPELVDGQGVDPFALSAIADLERDGNPVTPDTVRRVHAAMVAALPR